MAIRDIVRYGDERLVAKNEDVIDFEDPALQQLIQDLFDTGWAAPGLGIAAPQIGVNRRVCVVDLSVGKDPSQRLVLVNPRVVDAEGLVRDEEGCLSFPDIVEIVER
ncbi:MAG TPA: peptide deformylase, partial [Thermoanaerobaculia bacterium]|nr:peptide deformylase [Thermoanaerobaculia bacterium]